MSKELMIAVALAFLGILAGIAGGMIREGGYKVASNAVYISAIVLMIGAAIATLIDKWRDRHTTIA